jgi:hypothetical protein
MSIEFFHEHGRPHIQIVDSIKKLHAAITFDNQSPMTQHVGLNIFGGNVMGISSI